MKTPYMAFRSKMIQYALSVLVLLLSVSAVHAAPLLFWDFENSTSAGNVSTSEGSSFSFPISGFASQTGGGPAELFSAPARIVHLTRFFGSQHPFIEFTTEEPIYLERLSFQHIHNHNPGFPNFPSYEVQLQIDTGSGFFDIGNRVVLSPDTSGATDTVFLNLALAPGTYQIRWAPRNLPGGATDTDTGFFALNDVALNGELAFKH